MPFRRPHSLPVEYKGVLLDCGYLVDILVADLVVVQVKTVDTLSSIHEAQLLTYLRSGGWQVGLLINFNASKLTSGVRRMVLDLDE